MEAYFLYIANKLESIRTGPTPKVKLLDVKELTCISFWRAVFAEFLSTMLFVFLGCASAIFSQDTVQISLAFGLAIMSLIQMIGHVSGGHINPAVSIAMAVSMDISILRAVMYVIAQCGGGVVGGFILKSVTPQSLHGNLGVTNIESRITAAQGFGVELILTFCLVCTIYGTVDPNRPDFGSASLAIGLTVAMAHFSGIYYTGASMNPARTLGSAVASNAWQNHWIYWAGPIVGGVLAAVIYKCILNPYRCKLSMEDAVQQMVREDAVVVVPKEFLKNSNLDSKAGGKGDIPQVSSYL